MGTSSMNLPQYLDLRLKYFSFIRSQVEILFFIRSQVEILFLFDHRLKYSFFLIFFSSKLCINFANKTALFSNNDPVMGADIFHRFFISVYMIPYPCVNYHIHKYAMVCTLYLQVPQCMVLQCRLNFAPWNLIPKSPV